MNEIHSFNIISVTLISHSLYDIAPILEKGLLVDRIRRPNMFTGVIVSVIDLERFGVRLTFIEVPHGDELRGRQVDLLLGFFEHGATGPEHTGHRWP